MNDGDSETYHPAFTRHRLIQGFGCYLNEVVFEGANKGAYSKKGQTRCDLRSVNVTRW
jgi:hypothetical protein